MKTEVLTLEKYSYGGDAFGRLADKRAVFVPFALPGEHVRIQIVEEKKGYARGELLAVLERLTRPHRSTLPHFTHLRRLPLPTFAL